MTLRFYLVPSVNCLVGGMLKPNSRCPKYFANNSGISWGHMDYGADDIFLVLADVTPEQHTAISANSDVTTIVQHSNLDNILTAGQVTAVRDGLEALNIPGNWVTTANTWREVLRVVCGCFQFQQRVYRMFERSVFREGANLNISWGALPAGIRADVRAAADSFGWDYSTVNNSWTVGQILRHLALQWGRTPFNFGVATI